jgi:hypothetical protein
VQFVSFLRHYAASAAEKAIVNLLCTHLDPLA